MPDEPRLTVSLRYGKLSVTIGIAAVVGLFWLVYEAVSIRTLVYDMAAERRQLIQMVSPIPEMDKRLTRVENRLDFARNTPRGG